MIIMPPRLWISVLPFVLSAEIDWHDPKDQAAFAAEDLDPVPITLYRIESQRPSPGSLLDPVYFKRMIEIDRSYEPVYPAPDFPTDFIHVLDSIHPNLNLQRQDMVGHRILSTSYDQQQQQRHVRIEVTETPDVSSPCVHACQGVLRLKISLHTLPEKEHYLAAMEFIAFHVTSGHDVLFLNVLDIRIEPLVIMYSAYCLQRKLRQVGRVDDLLLYPGNPETKLQMMLYYLMRTRERHEESNLNFIEFPHDRSYSFSHSAGVYVVSNDQPQVLQNQEQPEPQVLVGTIRPRVQSQKNLICSFVSFQFSPEKEDLGDCPEFRFTTASDEPLVQTELFAALQFIQDQRQVTSMEVRVFGSVDATEASVFVLWFYAAVDKLLQLKPEMNILMAACHIYRVSGPFFGRNHPNIRRISKIAKVGIDEVKWHDLLTFSPHRQFSNTVIRVVNRTLRPRRPALFSPRKFEPPPELLAPELYQPRLELEEKPHEEYTDVVPQPPMGELSLRGPAEPERQRLVADTVPGKVNSLAVEMNDAVLKVMDEYEQVLRQKKKKDNQGLPSREEVVEKLQETFLYFNFESTLADCDHFKQYYIETADRLRSTSDVSAQLKIYEDYHRQVKWQIVPWFLTYVKRKIREEKAREEKAREKYVVLRHPHIRIRFSAEIEALIADVAWHHDRVSRKRYYALDETRARVRRVFKEMFWSQPEFQKVYRETQELILKDPENQAAIETQFQYDLEQTLMPVFVANYLRQMT